MCMCILESSLEVALAMLGSHLCHSGPLVVGVGVGRALKEPVALGIVIHVRT